MEELEDMQIKASFYLLLCFLNQFILLYLIKSYKVTDFGSRPKSVKRPAVFLPKTGMTKNG